MRNIKYFFLLLVLSGCATIGALELDKYYGQANVANRFTTSASTETQRKHFTNTIQPIIENRCVVCHGCYDAPCQLKMENSYAIERGANKTPVYNGERLLTAKSNESVSYANQLSPEKIQQFREQGFFPVLNERQQTPQANTQASVFYQMLQLKKEHPLPATHLLDNSFDLTLSRDQQCPTIEEFEQYKQKYPLAGMPYALPGLSDKEHNLLTTWLEHGAVMDNPPTNSDQEQHMVNKWETFLNGKSNKQQLVSRYLFEHLYLANLYFQTTEKQNTKQRYFNLVRSTTPPGEDVSIINTRRPFDAPFAQGNKHFYYRLVQNSDTIIAKRHMPYPFGEQKLNRYKALFIQPDYDVKQLPSYQLAKASNPFKTFQAIPAKSRYQFLLDEAQFSIMNFIKGPVCRGQIALNVIEDHFWVAFQDPNTIEHYHTEDFIAKNSDLLQLPAGTSDSSIALLHWFKYAQQQEEYINKKLEYIQEIKLKQHDLSLDLLWTGNGNPNATLTVFRHFDSASVVKGFIGEPPKTAWVISYPLLERIHYLLVAGFDVYGNVAHQLKTRLYMDFLRMEAESNFIALLPAKDRRKIHEHWYRDTSDAIKDYIFSEEFYQLPQSNIYYQSEQPQLELYELISQHTNNRKVDNLTLHSNTIEGTASTVNDYKMKRLNKMQGEALSLLPQISYVMVSGEQGDHVYTLINNTAHSNVAHLFSEENRRIPAEDTLTVARGIVGTYPNAFYKVEQEKLGNFVVALTQLKTEQDYRQLRDKYGVRRTHAKFWQYTDKLHHWYQHNQPDTAGLLDFNRLENR